MKKLIMPFHILVSVIGLSALVFFVQCVVFFGEQVTTEIYVGNCEFVSWNTDEEELQANITCNDQEATVDNPVVLNAYIVSNPEAFSYCRMFADFRVTCTIPDTEEE